MILNRLGNGFGVIISRTFDIVCCTCAELPYGFLRRIRRRSGRMIVCFFIDKIIYRNGTGVIVILLPAAFSGHSSHLLLYGNNSYLYDSFSERLFWGETS